MKWQFFHENHQFGKVVKMKGTNSSFVVLLFMLGSQELESKG